MKRCTGPSSATRWAITQSPALSSPDMLLTLLAAAFGMFAAAGAYAMDDAKRGEELYVRCAACHSLAQDRVGPRHCGIVGRRAGTSVGFEYSEAMRKSGLVWSAKTLDRFIADPMKTVPGTTMTYA